MAKAPTAREMATASFEERGLYKRLLASVRRKIGAQEAEDVVQDAYVRLASASERAPIRDEGAFLHTVATNLVRDRGRAAVTRATYAGDMDENVAADEPNAWQVLSSRQQLEVLEKALKELPEKRRAALVLFRFDGRSHVEIAEMLGLSVSMVEKHVRAALEHCRRRMREANGGDR